MNIAEGDEVSIGNNGNCKDEMGKKSPPPNNLNKATGYLMPNTK